ncbi:2-isopropylmalate synthase [Sphaerobacter thermophilus]|uniref:2-isopropylmalate synthase n=1 Tax=Sphaerobacter thermophilus (strain ATCC 49802 / DSM 20745 / KCCM 41009 / NCIMB 13125 / S 6022) TaxID=479434 RepID=D1C1T3_SPHTD|nr:2-isopropylmalate synthase [Sphaerobacter thermophilus]ACZ38200.1 2-isopropylmalate synthase [Sphaerobacter thermophilus DSM 20745]PZN66990.1 MAG: 2-isopropylmalate synthase [Sphaerobacter thermophilus]
MSDRLIIFDTTLRDGEQSPGATMATPEKLEVARMLARMGVDVIEAGFPAASPGDLEAVRTIAREVKGSVICALARANDQDIDAAWEGIRPAEEARIHTFIATSPVHMEYKLRMTPDQVVEAARRAVTRARGYVSNVEFSAEDATRSDWDFLCRIFAVAIEAGATTINVPDTVGYTTPAEYARLITYLMENTPGIENVVVSVHCHDDLGMATANTLAAIQAGARQAEVTINGIGERAGNTSLEEVVMALHTRKDFYGGIMPRIETQMLVPASRLVSRTTGIVVQPNKAIVGANAFAHEAGIHQDGMLKHRDTYEIMTPQSVGWESSRLVLGKHSGRAGFTARLKELGYGDLSREQIEELYRRFIDLTDRKKTVTNADLIAIVEEDLQHGPERYVLSGWRAHSGSDGQAEAWVKMVIDGVEREASAVGNGQIDALFKAIDRLVNSGCTLEAFHIDAVTPGEDAQGEVTVRVRCGANIYNGRGVATDIVEAGVRAYLMALNRAGVATEVTV